MSHQLDLFNNSPAPRNQYGATIRPEDAASRSPLGAPHSGGATSRAAAEAIAPRAGTQRRAVYDAIATAPDGLTDQEIARRCGISENAARPRRSELLDAGLISDSGRKRRLATGNFAVVYVAMPQRRETDPR